ncbi:MAG: cysteine peptidase family C39 domain-containing protein [Patescibacteria group bacterium]
MKLISFPEFRQTFDYDCGASAMQSILAFYGIDVGEKQVMKIAGTAKAGTSIKGIKKVARKFGLKAKSGAMSVKDIKKFINKNIPVIVPLQAWANNKNNKKVDWEKDWRDGHYVIAIGYDKEKFYFEDPAAVLRTYLAYDEFEKRWHDSDTNRKKYNHYGIIIYGKKPSYNLKKAKHMD